MKDDALNSEPAKSSHPHRRLFHWGIVFWMLAWIATVCCYAFFELNVKGCKGVAMGTGIGSIACQVDDNIVTTTKFSVRDFGVLWSDGNIERVRQGPGIMGILAGGGWRKRAGTTYILFPIAGLLWLWLAVGWAAEIRCRRLTNLKVDGNTMVTSYSRRRLIALTVLLIVLGVATPYLAMRAQQTSDEAACFLNIRNIQMAIRGWAGVKDKNIGQPIVWSDIIGISGYLAPESGKCPSGGEYLLCPLYPAEGELAARCPHPEHQLYIRNQNTFDW